MNSRINNMIKKLSILKNAYENIKIIPISLKILYVVFT